MICGPTAVGKTSLSIEIAQKFNGEIISADSRQFFKELNIGTAKPTAEDLKSIPHHFINSHSIVDEYTAGKFEKDGLRVIDDIISRKKLPLVVGGSGLYIQALMEGIDQPPADTELRAALNNKLEREGLKSLQNQLKVVDREKYQSIDIRNPRRVLRAIEIAELKKRGVYQEKSPSKRNFESLTLVLNRDREDLYKRINLRVEEMVNMGLVKEVEALLDHKEVQAMQTVGYKELVTFFEGATCLEEAIALIKQNSRRYAKRQITWFKRLEIAEWLHPEDKDKIFTAIDDWLSQKGQNGVQNS